MASDTQYEFGSYRLDAQSGMLFREGERVALSPKVAELLVALVQAEGSVLTRKQLLQGPFVEVTPTSYSLGELFAGRRCERFKLNVTFVGTGLEFVGGDWWRSLAGEY